VIVVVCEAVISTYRSTVWWSRKRSVVTQCVAFVDLVTFFLLI